jgi:outer membrane protein assembly factor BamB
LIWENRYGTEPTAPAMRGIAIYDDKIFVTTGRHLMAFDARNGKVVWDADRSKGEYSNNSGPLAVKAG